MDSKNLEKNILDLKYKFQIEKIHASLTMLTLGIISFIGTFIWYSERLVFGIAVSIIIVLISVFYYNKTKKHIVSITKEIRNLSPN